MRASRTKGRGARLSDQLAELRDWDVSPVVPGTVRDRRPELLVGGMSGAAFARMARYGDGYAHGGGPPRAFASAAAKALRRVERSRPPRAAPRCGARPTSRSATRRPARRTCSTTTPSPGPFAAKIAAGNLTSPRAIRDFVRAYEEAGCDELVLLPTVADLGQLERLAEVLA